MNKEEFDLIQFLRILWARFFYMILFAILGGGIAAVISVFLIPPQYTATVSMYVYNNQTRQEATISDIDMSVKLVDTYIVILKSNTVLNEVASQSGLGYTVDHLHRMVSAQPINNTEVFEVKVKSENPDHARILARTVAKIAPIEIMRVVKAGSVEIIDNAPEQPPKTSPDIPKNTVIGFLGGAVAAVIIILLQLLLDKSIRKESELTETFGFSVLGSIPSFGKNSARGESYGR